MGTNAGMTGIPEEYWSFVPDTHSRIRATPNFTQSINGHRCELGQLPFGAANIQVYLVELWFNIFFD